MKTKHKRLIIIGITVAWGMIALGILFLGNSLLGVPKEPNLLAFICALSSGFTIRICREFDLFGQYPNIIAMSVAFTIQYFVCILIGIVFAFAAYAPWRKTKLPPESTQQGK